MWRRCRVPAGNERDDGGDGLGGTNDGESPQLRLGRTFFCIGQNMLGGGMPIRAGCVKCAGAVHCASNNALPIGPEHGRYLVDCTPQHGPLR